MNYVSDFPQFWFGFIIGMAVMAAFIRFKEWQYNNRLNKVACSD